MSSTDMQRLCAYYARHSTNPLDIFLASYYGKLRERNLDYLIEMPLIVRMAKKKWDQLDDRRKFYYVLWANKNKYRLQSRQLKASKKQWKRLVDAL